MRLFTGSIDALLADAQPLPRLWYFPGTPADTHAGADRRQPHCEPSSCSVTPPSWPSAEHAGGPTSRLLSSPRLPPLLPAGSARQLAGATATRAGDAPVLPRDFPAAAPTTSRPATRRPRNGSIDAVARRLRARRCAHHRIEWAGWVDPGADDGHAGATACGWTFRSTRGARPMFKRPRATPATQAHGYINGSGLPMRFVNQAGEVLTVYQQVTSLVDEQLLQPEHPRSRQNLRPRRRRHVSSRSHQRAARPAAIRPSPPQFHVDYIGDTAAPGSTRHAGEYYAGRQVPIWPMGALARLHRSARRHDIAAWRGTA